MIHLKLGIIDALICEVAKYCFADAEDLDHNTRKIVKNFCKKGNAKKNSLNAAYDLFFIFCTRAIHNREMESFNGKVDSWCMTADNGIASLPTYITFPNINIPCAMLHNKTQRDTKKYLELCDYYYRFILWQRETNLDIQKGIVDIANIVRKAEILIEEIDTKVI